MKSVRYLNKLYDNDLINFLSWFDYDIKENCNPNLNVVLLTQLLYKIRTTQGLEETIDFINDIHNSKDLSIEFINLYCVNPGKRTLPYIFKMRTTNFKKGIDKMFDNNIENKKCILCIPLKNAAFLEYIDESEFVDDTTINQNFKIGTSIAIGDVPFIMPVDSPFCFNNYGGANTLVMLQVGFECNPDIDDVYNQLSK